MRECPLRANHLGQKRPRETSHLLHIIVIIHIHSEPPEKKSALILKPHRRNETQQENFWFTGHEDENFRNSLLSVCPCCKSTSLLILDLAQRRCGRCDWKKRSTRVARFQACCPLFRATARPSPSPRPVLSFSLVHSRLRRPREQPRIMTLLRDHSQLTAIKTLVIAVNELYNYDIAPRCIVLRYDLTNLTFHSLCSRRFQWSPTLCLKLF